MALPDGSTLEDLQKRIAADHAAAAGLLSVCRYAVNAEYAEAGQVIPDGAEVGVIPPVSGGAGDAECVVHSQIVRRPIDVQALASAVAVPECGAALTFAGAVRRDSAEGRTVTRITYEGYERMAEETLGRIAGEVARQHGARVSVEHRLGCLEIGEISVGIAVAAPHRGDGFAALRDMIERIKKDLPIWKKEEFSDGTAEWLGAGDRSPP